MKPFPTLNNADPKALQQAVNQIARIRQDDIGDRNNFPNIFIGGRKVSKVPATSTDITGSAVGDFNVTASFAYFCINNSGTVEWVRVAVGTF